MTRAQLARKARRARLLVFSGCAALLMLHHVASALGGEPPALGANAVDTALILAVDVSQSVDANRYQLQIEGIARAIEDPGVISAVLGGPMGAIAILLVEWADDVDVRLDWQIIRSAEDARRVAGNIRALKPWRGEYTCMTRMLRIVGDRILDTVPGRAAKVVLDVSGDGIDNCADAEEAADARDTLVERGVTINGLPVMVPGENDIVGSGAYRAPGYGLRALERGPDTATTTLEAWFRSNIIGGRGAFLLPANGYQDFGRAFRQKFVTEVSADMTEHERRYRRDRSGS